jgi:hypothetical protein
MSLLLNNLGSSIRSRFERTWGLAHIPDAISLHQKAFHLTPEGHEHMPSCLNILAVTSNAHNFLEQDVECWKVQSWQIACLAFLMCEILTFNPQRYTAWTIFRLVNKSL